MRIPARTLLNYTTEQLMDMLTGSFVLVFDDGELTTTYGEALYSRYFWELHRHYPRTPLLTKHHCQKVLKGNLLNNKTHIKLCESIYRDVIRENHLKPIRFQNIPHRSPILSRAFHQHGGNI